MTNKRRAVTVRLPEQAYDLLTTVAASEGVSRGEWVGKVVLAELNRQPETHDDKLRSLASAFLASKTDN